LLAGKQFTKWKHVIRVNLALGRIAAQSHGSDAGLAVDGNRNTFSDTGHRSSNPWWQVSIDSHFTITNIIMHNRFDMYTERLTNFTIEIFQDDTELYKVTFHDQIPAETMHITDIDVTESQMIPNVGVDVKITLN